MNHKLIFSLPIIQLTFFPRPTHFQSSDVNATCLHSSPNRFGFHVWPTHRSKILSSFNDSSWILTEHTLSALNECRMVDSGKSVLILIRLINITSNKHDTYGMEKFRDTKSNLICYWDHNAFIIYIYIYICVYKNMTACILCPFHGFSDK